MKTSRFIIPIALGLIVISQFNNCDNFSASNTSSMLSSECVGSTDCYTQSADALEVDMNTGGAYGVSTGIQAFYLGGYCNEAGFSRNKIIWELYVNTALVRASQNLGVNTSCVNGRFTLYIDLSAARAGLMNPAQSNARVQHYLDVEIIGIDNKNLEHRSNFNSRKRVILNPI